MVTLYFVLLQCFSAYFVLFKDYFLKSLSLCGSSKEKKESIFLSDKEKIHILTFIANIHIKKKKINHFLWIIHSTWSLHVLSGN